MNYANNIGIHDLYLTSLKISKWKKNKKTDSIDGKEMSFGKMHG